MAGQVLVTLRTRRRPAGAGGRAGKAAPSEGRARADARRSEAAAPEAAGSPVAVHRSRPGSIQGGRSPAIKPAPAAAAPASPNWRAIWAST